MKKIDFIEENVPKAELFIITGGDYVHDFIMELRVDEKRHRYSLYELYQEGCQEDDFEGVIDCFKKHIKMLEREKK